MAQTLCVIFAILLCNGLCQSATIAEHNSATELRSKRTAKIDDLKEKLANLQKALADLEKSKTEEHVAPPEKPKPVQSEPEDPKSEAGEQTLSPQDILLLKSLKLAVQSLHDHDENKVDKKQDMGKFYETPLRQLAVQTDDKRTLQGQFYLQDPANSHRQPQDGVPARRSHSDTVANTNSGQFGDFSDNRTPPVLQTVVYNLLKDLDFALKKGISVEDIIQFLYETEQATRENQKRSRIEDEEKQLKALLINQKPSPRD